MAARRAAAKAAAAAAAEPPPPPEPAPEPEPEKKEPEKAVEKKPTDEDEANKGQNGDSKTGRVAERIIERIIICPGGQNPYMTPPPPPPPQGVCHCVPVFVDRPKKKQDKGKGKKRGGDDKENEPCKHPFCIVQRARTKPQGLPWASGLYKQQHPTQGPETPAPPPVVICQRPVMCCCPKCRPTPESDSEDEDPPREDTETFMTFMNMVFAAANVMNENPHAF